MAAVDRRSDADLAIGELYATHARGLVRLAWLLLHGELPTAPELEGWEALITEHRMLPDKLKTVLAGFPYDAHPMTILMASVAAFFSFYPDAQNFTDPEARAEQLAGFREVAARLGGPGAAERAAEAILAELDRRGSS